nr:hypothetical protein OG546_03495 [Streptomyces antimycoticus]
MLEPEVGPVADDLEDPADEQGREGCRVGLGDGGALARFGRAVRDDLLGQPPAGGTYEVGKVSAARWEAALGYRLWYSSACSAAKSTSRWTGAIGPAPARPGSSVPTAVRRASPTAPATASSRSRKCW